MAQSHAHKAARVTRGRTVPKQRSRFPLIVGALALVALVLGTIIVSRLAQPAATTEPFTARVINAPTGTTPEGYAYKGSPDAPVTVIEYGDFQCPSCAAFSQQMEAQFDQQRRNRRGALHLPRFPAAAAQLRDDRGVGGTGCR